MSSTDLQTSWKLDVIKRNFAPFFSRRIQSSILIIIITAQVFMYILVMTPRKYAQPLHFSSFSATGNRKLIRVLGWYVHLSFQDIKYKRFLQFSTYVYFVETNTLRNGIFLWRVLKEEIQVFMNYIILSFLFFFLFCFSQLRKAAKVKEKRNWERYEFTFKVACVVGAWKKERGTQERREGRGSMFPLHVFLPRPVLSCTHYFQAYL